MSISRDVDSFIRPAIKSLTGVSYNKSPDLLGKKIPAEEIIKLNGNENPYGCSPRVNQMLAEYKKFHILLGEFSCPLRANVYNITGGLSDFP